MANKTFCSNCSEEITGKKFCSKCGTKVEISDKDWFKKDIQGIEAYFKERDNMARIFNELNSSLHNGDSANDYLIKANLLHDEEIKQILATGFSDIYNMLGFLKENEKKLIRTDKEGNNFEILLHKNIMSALNDAISILKDEKKSKKKELKTDPAFTEDKDVLVNAWDDSPGLTDGERRLQGQARVVLRQRAEDKARDAGKKEFEFPEGSGKMHEVTIKKARSGGCLGVLLIGFILAISLVNI